MNKFLRFLVAVAVVLGAYVSMPELCFDCGQAFAASPTGFAGTYFQETRYYAHGGTGSGKSASNPASITDQDVFALRAGTLVTNAYVILDVAVTGTTAVNVGDDDDNDGYCPTASVTLATPGMYCWDAKSGGAYKRVQTAGATDAADIYVVPNAKFYAAAGKEVKLDVTGTSTAGAFRVVVEGFYYGR